MCLSCVNMATRVYGSCLVTSVPHATLHLFYTLMPFTNWLLCHVYNVPIDFKTQGHLGTFVKNSVKGSHVAYILFAMASKLMEHPRSPNIITIIHGHQFE